MLRLRYPVFVVLGMFVACGGKVLVDQNGGSDPGTGGSGIVLPGASGANVGSSGSIGTAGAYVAGSFNAGGASTAGFYGTGGVYTAGSAGFFAAGGGGFSPCGPTI